MSAHAAANWRCLPRSTAAVLGCHWRVLLLLPPLLLLLLLPSPPLLNRLLLLDLTVTILYTWPDLTATIPPYYFNPTQQALAEAAVRAMPQLSAADICSVVESFSGEHWSTAAGRRQLRDAGSVAWRRGCSSRRL